MQALIAGVLAVVGAMLGASAQAGPLDSRQPGAVYRLPGPEAQRSGPAAQARRDLDRVRPPYPPSYYRDTDRSSQGCAWLMDRAIRTNNKNWLQRYRACAR